MGWVGSPMGPDYTTPRISGVGSPLPDLQSEHSAFLFQLWEENAL